MKYMPDELPDDLKEQLLLWRSTLNGYIDCIIKDENEAAFLKNILVLWIGEKRQRSALLGEHLLPSDAYPDGAILLHVDAIASSAHAVGSRMDALMAATLFHEIAHWYTIESKGDNYQLTDKDEQRADTVSRGHCRKLHKRNLISSLPPDLNGDKDVTMSFLLWLQKWTKMTPQQWEEYMAGYGNNT